MPQDPHDPSGEEAAKQLISLAEAAQISGFTPEHMRLLVRTGRVWGTKIGRNWLTTEQAVRDYLATDRRPGPKPSE